MSVMAVDALRCVKNATAELERRRRMLTMLHMYLDVSIAG